VSSGSVSLPAGSVGNAALASGLNATKITTGTFGVGDFGECNISTTGTLNAGYSTLGDISCGSLTLSGTTLIDALLSAYNFGHDIGKAQDMSSAVTPNLSDMTWNDVHITGGVNIYASDPGYFLSLDYLNNDTYGFGQWSGATARAVFSGSNANATFNISKPTGASTFNDMVTVTSSGNMGLGVSPSTTYKLDVAGRMHATSGAQFDSNVTVSGTLSATTYSGLQRKVWNASTLGFANTTNTVKYHKIATFGGTNAGNTAGSVYITGTMGGYISNQTTKVAIDIANRGGITITGSAFGYPSTTSTITNLVLYWEGSNLTTSPWSLYIVSKGQFQVWDLSVSACQLGVVIYEPSTTYVTDPTNGGAYTQVCSLVIGRLNQVTELSSGTAVTSYNNYLYTYSAGWASAGTANSDTIQCGTLSCSTLSSCGAISGTTITASGAVACVGLNVTSSSTATINTMTSILAPSLTSGNYMLNVFGTGQATNNCGFFAFNNVGGSNSTSNYAGFGTWGNLLGPATFNACAGGKFGVCTATPAYTLDVYGTGKYSSNLICGNFTCGPTFSVGSTSGTPTSAGAPHLVSTAFDAVGTSHSIGIPPGCRNAAGLLHVYVKNLNSAYGGSKAGYMRLYYIACSGDTNNNFTVIESYNRI
jgi:hypothetical protein